MARRVLERLDAELSDTDDAGRPRMVGKVALAAVVGNEDGAHKIVADLFRPSMTLDLDRRAGMHLLERRGYEGTDYTDLDDVPEAVASATGNAVRNAVHLATVLRQNTYPAYE